MKYMFQHIVRFLALPAMLPFPVPMAVAVGLFIFWAYVGIWSAVPAVCIWVGSFVFVKARYGTVEGYAEDWKRALRAARARDRAFHEVLKAHLVHRRRWKSGLAEDV